MSTTMRPVSLRARFRVGAAARRGIALPLAMALLLALALAPFSSGPATALSVADYFTYNYTVGFSKSQVAPGEAFNATVEASAVCINNVPLGPSEASFTGRIVAVHQVSGASVTLNPSYTLTLAPFPARAGESAQVSQVVPLQFPDGSQLGAYNVVAELIEAKVKVVLIWIPVTSYLPSSQSVGSVAYGVVAGGGGGGAAPPVLTLPQSTPSSITGAGQATWTPTTSGLTPATITVAAPDGKGMVAVPSGTLARDGQGNPLAAITFDPPSSPAPAPPDKNIVVAYDLGPPGATFGSPVTVTMKYDPAALPAGAAESNLIIATYNAGTGAWTPLGNIVVDTVNRTVSGATDHFSQFAILSSRASAGSPAPPGVPTRPPAPAARAPAPPPASTPAPAVPAVPAPAPASRAPLIGMIAGLITAGLVAGFVVTRRRRTGARM